MQRSLLVCALTALAAAILASSSHAAEKTPTAAPAADAAVKEAREHLQQALLAETLGDNQERAARLGKALLAAPDLPEANWHSARVRVGNEWLPLSQVVNRAQSDPNLQEYRELRDKAVTAKALRDLARWCNKNNLPDLMRLHYAQLLGHENADAEMKKEAVRQLDLREVNGAWVPADELKAREEQAKQVEAAIAKWRPLLKKLQEQIDGEDYARRDRAIEEFHKLDDVAIIPVLESFLLDAGERFQEEAIERLATFPHYEATEVLVRYAILGRTSIVRDQASAALKPRPMHEFVPLLLAGLTAPFKSRFQIVWDRQGKISYSHALLREGSSANLLLMSHDLAVPRHSVQKVRKDDTVRVYAPEVPKTDVAKYSLGVTPAQALALQLSNTKTRAGNIESEVLLANSAIAAANERVFEALEISTGKQMAREPLKWWSWWQSFNQNYWPRPTSYAYRSNAYNYYSSQTYITHLTGTRGYSCFLAGTPVRTQLGQVPIESIKPGDRVLAQDQDTGELAYKVVIATTIRPPAKMVSIDAGGEKIVTTLGHPFWVAGHGWKMAQELKTGDLLHGLGGTLSVSAIEPTKEAAAHNLVVDDFNTYFVGQAGLLVHDNEFRKPTRAVVPGLVAE
jgi:hypothetical protein